ncbi:MAG TPA: DUF1501 domain-containing protein [Acidobacteriota bacterium]|jgi:hypothetical protein
MAKENCWNCSNPDLRRREFIRVGSLSLLGISLPQLLRFQEAMAGADRQKTKATAQSCILFFLEGGPSQVDTWDPKPNSSFKPISTNVPGIQISGLLPSVAKHMDKLAVIRSMHSQEPNHLQAMQYILTGHRPSTVMGFPSFGSIIFKEVGPRNAVPPHVLIQPQWKSYTQYERYFQADFVGAEYNPMMVSDPSQDNFTVADLTLPKSISVDRIEHRRSFLKVWDQLHREKLQLAENSELDSFTQQALNMVLTPAVRDAFDLSKEADKTREAYGRDSIGQSLLLARRLVEAGSRFVTAAGYKPYQWDTHGQNDDLHKKTLVPPMDRALSALLDDLDQRGLLSSTIVLVMGEFGRVPHYQNNNGGRDHWIDAWSMALGGGGIRGGQVIGATNETGAEVVQRPLSPGDLFATIYKAFGIDWTKEYMHPVGRPIKIANSKDDKTGAPIKELL